MRWDMYQEQLQERSDISRSVRIKQTNKASNMTTSASDSAPTELSDFLMAVAADRDKVAFAKLFNWFAPKISRIAAQKQNSKSRVTE